jgi:very-short-patch-repair endonuclease
MKIITPSNSMYYGANPATMRAAARLRKNLTLCEYLLWKKLRDRKIFNTKFRKQHPVNNFIVDFYCHEYKLVIEVDGDYHNDEDQIQYDLDRTSDLINFGLKVIRFTNFEIINDIDHVIEEILNSITTDTPLQGAGGLQNPSVCHLQGGRGSRRTKR